MVDCSHFLENHGDLRDGRLDSERRGAMERHLAECRACARYDRAVDEGVQLMQRLPEVQPSLDFAARLQQRITTLEVQQAGRARSSEVSLPLAVAIAVAIGASAWIPTGRARQDVQVLPPIAAHAPVRAEALPGFISQAPALSSREERTVAPTARRAPGSSRAESVGFHAADLPLESLAPPSLEWGQISSEMFFQYSPMATYISYQPGVRNR